MRFLLFPITCLILCGCSDTAAPVPTDPLVIEARGIDRVWQFTYTGTKHVVTKADLTVPQATDVVINLRSDDYLYVFSCPTMNLKEIAVPDLEYEISFGSGAVAVHDLEMDPMCGFTLPPGETMGALSVVDPADFQRWLKNH